MLPVCTAAAPAWRLHQCAVKPNTQLHTAGVLSCYAGYAVMGSRADDDDYEMESEEPTEELESDPEEQLQQGGRQTSTAVGRKRKRPSASIGGVAAVGATGLRSQGRYGAALVQSCRACGGGPHQASLQAQDSVVREFLASCWQQQNQKQKTDEWMRKYCSVLAAVQTGPHLEHVMRMLGT